MKNAQRLCMRFFIHPRDLQFPMHGRHPRASRDVGEQIITDDLRRLGSRDHVYTLHLRARLRKFADIHTQTGRFGI